MKKLLYITCNSKPENMSISKLVGREFINRFLAVNPDHYPEELDLYKENIPEINHNLFTGRAEPVSGEKYNALSENEKQQVDKIISLCDQFLSADTYVIAAPMWNVSFPSRLKRYIDCVIINNKTIMVAPEEIKGLMNDKERNMVYIQSSGGYYPAIFSGKFNHGINYFRDVFKFLGISRFEKVLVEGIDKTSIGKDEAIAKAFKDIDHVIEKLSNKVLI
ncbi:MAG: FMN-dependent NADH-azoreductase [Clostridiaceae bacterium]|nr:FMN-dependent NADH-azoreductase [Clostridiaceae bacterium]